MPTMLETATVPRTVTPTLLKILDIACEINKYQPSFISSIASLNLQSLTFNPYFFLDNAKPKTAEKINVTE